jgi:Big-like domain-containing protein/glycosyl hydrolase family 26
MGTVGRLPAPWGKRALATMLGLAMVGGLTVLAPTRPAGAVLRASGPLAPAEGVLFGAHARSSNSTESEQKASVLDLESKLGRKLAIDHYYRPWTTLFPTFREQWDFDNGRIPMISWGKTYSSEIILGQHDDLIRTRAAAVAALGRPLFLRYFWEMDGSRNLDISQSPQAYILAWRHIHDLFVEQGATNAVFVWCPNSFTFTDGTAQQYYPGDDYVDWTCADGYNWYEKSKDTDASLKSIFTDFYDWATSRAKPIMVGEYGVLEANSDPDHKPEWVAEARDTLKADFPAIGAMVYFNSAGNDSDGDFRDWRVNTTPASLLAFQAMAADPYFNGAPSVPTPGTGITSGPAGTVNSNSPTFAFSSDQAGATFQCHLDSASFSPCTSPITYTGLGQGSHTFEVRATTAGGGTDSTPARRTWAVDTTPPTVTAINPAAGAGGVTIGTGLRAVFSEALYWDTVTPASFTLSSAAGPVAATVTYDSATRAASLSPNAPLQPGTLYTATVEGGPDGVTDVVGNPLAVDKVWTFTTAALPETTITSGPPSVTASTVATLAFSSDQPGTSFQCRLDGAAFADCISSVSYSGLAEGAHSFEVRAWTLAAGTDPSPAVRSWSVDTTAPTVTAITPADGATGVPVGGPVQVTFSEAINPVTVTPATLTLTGGGSSVGASVSYDAPSRTATLSPTSPLQTGTTYTVTVKGGPSGVADTAGNRLAADRTSSFTTFAVAPDTSVDAGPADASTSATATFAFSSDQPGAGLQCRLDGAPFADCTSPVTFNGLTDGPHAFEARAWTFAGGADPSPAGRSWTVDTTPPTVTTLAPAAGSTGVPTGAVVQVTFAEAVDPATVTTANITLASGSPATPVTATVSYDPATRTASLSPAAPLQAATTYTATARGGVDGVADVIGNRMASDRVWQFSTAGSVPVSTSIKLGPVADARVEEAHASTNYGKSTKLKAEGGSDPDIETYLRFDVKGLTGTVRSAKLRLYVYDPTGDGPAVYATGNSWTESGTGSITWKNRPGRNGSAVDDKGKLTKGTWVEYDVKSLVQGNGMLSFVLATNATDSVVFYSREGSKRPELVITAG